MLPTNIQLKCNEGKELPRWYFQYPVDNGPATFKVDDQKDAEKLHASELGGFVFNDVLPILMGIIVLLFFIISSSFVVYAIVRHVYTDHLLPRKAKMVRKLGKHPESKRRKKYRTRNKKGSRSVGKKKPNMNLFMASAAAMKLQRKQYRTFVKTEDMEAPFYLESFSPHPPSPVEAEEDLESDLDRPDLFIDNILKSPAIGRALETPKESYTSIQDIHSFRKKSLHKDPSVRLMAELKPEPSKGKGKADVPTKPNVEGPWRTRIGFPLRNNAPTVEPPAAPVATTTVETPPVKAQVENSFPKKIEPQLTVKTEVPVPVKEAPETPQKDEAEVTAIPVKRKSYVSAPRKVRPPKKSLKFTSARVAPMNVEASAPLPHGHTQNKKHLKRLSRKKSSVTPALQKRASQDSLTRANRLKEIESGLDDLVTKREQLRKQLKVRKETPTIPIIPISTTETETTETTTANIADATPTKTTHGKKTKTKSKRRKTKSKKKDSNKEKWNSY